MSKLTMNVNRKKLAALGLVLLIFAGTLWMLFWGLNPARTMVVRAILSGDGSRVLIYVQNHSWHELQFAYWKSALTAKFELKTPSGLLPMDSPRINDAPAYDYRKVKAFDSLLESVALSDLEPRLPDWPTLAPRLASGEATLRCTLLFHENDGAIRYGEASAVVQTADWLKHHLAPTSTP